MCCCSQVEDNISVYIKSFSPENMQKTRKSKSIFQKFVIYFSIALILASDTDEKIIQERL